MRVLGHAAFMVSEFLVESFVFLRVVSGSLFVARGGPATSWPRGMIRGAAVVASMRFFRRLFLLRELF